MGGNSNSPCASCKLLRRRCAKDCIFAPYFPSDDPHKFAMVHKVFGASNVSKMLQELPVHQRADAVSSIVYEANARMRDPVYGCVGAISYLQNQVSELQMQLAVAQTEILCIQMQQQGPAAMPTPHHQQQQQQLVLDDPSDDDKYSFFHHHHNNDNNSSNLSAHHYLINYPSSSSSTTVIQESLKREPLFGHDMVSS